jgi:hypothetical protein
LILSPYTLGLITIFLSLIYAHIWMHISAARGQGDLQCESPNS